MLLKSLCLFVCQGIFASPSNFSCYVFIQLISMFFPCSQTRARGIENSILQSREGYRPIARRAAVMFDVARIMAEINTAYQTSLAQFLMVFDAAIKHSER